MGLFSSLVKAIFTSNGASTSACAPSTEGVSDSAAMSARNGRHPAARRLSVSPGRITHMLDSGILTGYRKGRRTYVTVESIAARLTDTPRSGRPKRRAVA